MINWWIRNLYCVYKGVISMLNPYFSKFLSLDIWTHFVVFLEMLFGYRGSFFFYCFEIVVVFLIFVALFSVVIRIIDEFEEKNKKGIILIDIISICIFAVLGSILFNSYSGMRTAISSTGAFYGTPFRGLVYYRENIGILCGILYSFLINHRLLKKYLVKLKIDKYGKVIFSAIFIIFLFVSYYFYFLCQLLSA